MKKKITFLLITSFLGVQLLTAQNATLDITYLSTPPTIDGSEADWPNDVPIHDLQYTINKVEPMLSESPRKFSSTAFPVSDLAGYFRVAWDDDNFYVFVYVDDDVNGTGDASWRTDNIELYFNCDLGNDLPYTGPNDGTDGNSNSNLTGSDGIRDAIQMRWPRDTSVDNRVGPNWVVRYWGIERFHSRRNSLVCSTCQWS